MAAAPGGRAAGRLVPSTGAVYARPMSAPEASGSEPTGSARPDPREELRWYIAKYEAAYGQSTIPLSDQIRPLMSPAARLRAKVLATDAQAFVARRTAARLAAGSGPLRLHLGCGWNHIPGWVNSDLVGAKGDFAWNLLRPLPFADGSVDAVFMEHVFEHLRYSQVLRVLGHVRTVLRPGGVLRVGVPDAGMYARRYSEDPEGLAAERWGRPTGLLVLREVFQEHAHVTAYDGETLQLILAEGGFPNSSVTPGGESPLLGLAPDMDERIPETVYAEVRRPGM